VLPWVTDPEAAERLWALSERMTVANSRSDRYLPSNESRRTAGDDRRTQDEYKLRRYLRRWTRERLFRPLHGFGRLITRWEDSTENFLAFVHCACLNLSS